MGRSVVIIRHAGPLPVVRQPFVDRDEARQPRQRVGRVFRREWWRLGSVVKDIIGEGVPLGFRDQGRDGGEEVFGIIIHDSHLP